MNNLLHADFRRLLRDRLFWVLTAVMAIWAIILFLNHYSDKIRYGEQASLDSMFFSFAVLTGFASAAFCSLFTGREHSDGILRNKIIIGCSRTRIYLSGFLTCAAAMLLSTFAYMAVHVSNLRKKLRAACGRDYIESVWGIGFKLSGDHESEEHAHE